MVEYIHWNVFVKTCIIGCRKYKLNNSQFYTYIISSLFQTADGIAFKNPEFEIISSEEDSYNCGIWLPVGKEYLISGENLI